MNENCIDLVQCPIAIGEGQTRTASLSLACRAAVRQRFPAAADTARHHSIRMGLRRVAGLVASRPCGFELGRRSGGPASMLRHASRGQIALGKKMGNFPSTGRPQPDDLWAPFPGNTPNVVTVLPAVSIDVVTNTWWLQFGGRGSSRAL